MELIKIVDFAQAIISRSQEANRQANVVPVLTTVLIGDSMENVFRVGIMEGALKTADLVSRHLLLPADISLSRVLEEIEQLNRDETVDGIFVQLPLPESLADHTMTVLQAIDPKKDAGGLNPINRVLLGVDQSAVIPSYPAACLDVINTVFPSLSGKTALLVGVSFDLIIPLGVLLLKKGVKVTIWPKADASGLLAADIVVLHAGEPKLFKKDNFIAKSLVIDAGFYRQFGLCGNVDVDSLMELEGWLVSFPNGLYFAVNATIMENVSLAARNRHGQDGSGAFALIDDDGD